MACSLPEACCVLTISNHPAKGKTHEGFTYSLNQEKYLRVFLDDGEVPIDNNAAEQSIRSFL